jgi:Cys-tRNA(Pro) deacylase
MNKHVSETPATQFLKKRNIAFGEHPYDYVDRGGTAESALQLGVEEHIVVKTLVMQDEKSNPLIVLMHGDCQVSTKQLARQIGVKSVEPCKPEVLVGGTSPFGTKKPLPVYVEEGILALPLIYINGGKRGYLVSVAPPVLTSCLNAVPVLCRLP